MHTSSKSLHVNRVKYWSFLSNPTWEKPVFIFRGVIFESQINIPRDIRNQYLVPSPSERNLMGHECGRIVWEGVGPDSLSRDAVNSLSSRFSRSVETRRRYGCLRMVFTRCASSELQFGALREVVARERLGALSRKAGSNG